MSLLEQVKQFVKKETPLVRVYIASPYAHSDRNVKHERYVRAMQVTSQLMNCGVPVFSPIVHCHAMKSKGHLTLTEDQMREYDLGLLSLFDELWILALQGWAVSKGIKMEADFMRKLNRPIRIITVDEIGDITKVELANEDYQHYE